MTILWLLRVHTKVVRCSIHHAFLEDEVHISLKRRDRLHKLEVFRRGLFQDDSLSPLLFCVLLLPLLIELRGLSAYLADLPLKREHKVTHLFYMSEFKLYASKDKNKFAKASDFITEYTVAHE